MSHEELRTLADPELHEASDRWNGIGYDCICGAPWASKGRFCYTQRTVQWALDELAAKDAEIERLRSDLGLRVNASRRMFLDSIGAHSEDTYAAGWMSGIEKMIRRDGGEWIECALAANGWPIGYMAEGGWDPLTPEEIAQVAPVGGADSPGVERPTDAETAEAAARAEIASMENAVIERNLRALSWTLPTLEGGQLTWTAADRIHILSEHRDELVGGADRPTRETIAEGGYAEINGVWHVRPPGRRMAVPLGAHTVTTHDDGTITVAPSIVYSTPDRADYWHGFLTNGAWNEC